MKTNQFPKAGNRKEPMLKDCCDTILSQLNDLSVAIEGEQFSAELEILSGASIGMHFRHVIEFFDCLMQGISEGEINYDHRTRDILVERSPDIASAKIDQIKGWLQEQEHDQLVKFQSVMCEGESFEKEGVQSSLNRELVYAIEHAIHHMAIIKIAVLNAFPELKLDPNFGVALSTVRFRETACAQ